MENAESRIGQKLIRQTSRKVSLSGRWLMQYKLRVKPTPKSSGEPRQLHESQAMLKPALF
jgi:hypothetical protein